MPEQPRNLPNLYVDGGAEAESFTRPGGGDSAPPPERDRKRHAAALRQDLETAIAAGREVAAVQTEVPERDRGFYLEVRLPPDADAALESLEDRRQNFELLTVQKAEDSDDLLATLFVPQRSAGALVRKVDEYATAHTKKGKPKNQPLVARMEAARIAELRSVFTDPVSLFPRAGRETWWEVWLRAGQDEPFRSVADRLELPRKQHPLVFPERVILLLRATPERLSDAMAMSGAVAEVRLAKDTPSPFLEMPVREQVAWSTDVLERLERPPPEGVAVCILDTGVTSEHPLLSPATRPADLHSYDPAWGADDVHGHGTAMAGTALYGDLVDILTGNRRIGLTHRLESVKILPNTGDNERRLYGVITVDGIAQAEIAAPDRKRVICLATTSDGEGTGKPTSWSSAVDQLCYGEEDFRRLVVVAAGNLRHAIVAAEYPDQNDLAPIEDPAQAWNGLTVSGCTEKINIVDPDGDDLEVLAPAGGLCPTARTAITWETAWPNKPDVVMEGGNLVVDGAHALSHNDLSLLTTGHRPTLGLFRDFGNTSAAAAQVARLAAGILAARPSLWPETVRALVIHSAEWTREMTAFLSRAPDLAEKRTLLRRYGFGVPDLDRAVRSAANDLNLVVQDRIQPYELGAGGRPRTKDMHIHRLPWPSDLLQELADQPVEMRVTLSYFIEPNPGERGWTKRHQYASHGLRFEVKRVLEDDAQFRARINTEARPEGYEGSRPTGADRWFIGPTVRHTGSVHSDIWRGIAADLAQLDAIGVYPIGGWWKENRSLGRWHREVPYALVVSIRAPAAAVDLYTRIETRLRATVGITT